MYQSSTHSVGDIQTTMTSSKVVVGLDEAGVGACFASLWASAVHLTGPPIPGLCDSKRMTEKTRERMRVEVLTRARYGMGEVTHTEIDTIGLGEARRVVFERALDDFVSKYDIVPDHVIVDGSMYRPWRDVPYTLEPRADDTYACVSAASVLAKTTRDRQVIDICDAPDGEMYAQYDIRRNKGYLTKKHIDTIRRLGRTPLHRHSYNIRSLTQSTVRVSQPSASAEEPSHSRPERGDVRDT